MLDRVHNQVLQAINLSGQAQHLNTICHLLHCKFRVADLMPVVGSLVSTGYLQKVAPPSSASGPLHARSRPAGPVHFQLTDQGRRHLLSLPPLPQPQLKSTMHAQRSYSEDERDFRVDDGDDALDASCEN
jgi:hypothetical protein